MNKEEEEEKSHLTWAQQKTPIDVMRFILDLLPIMKTRQAVEQAKAYLKAVENPTNPLYGVVREQKDDWLKRGKHFIVCFSRHIMK